MGSSKKADALKVAYCYANIDGANHKAWVIDQMVRALCGCKYNFKTERYGENGKYQIWVKRHNQGEDGLETYSWDRGVAP